MLASFAEEESPFGFCTNLINVTLSNNLTWIGPATFFSCTSLTSITIPNSVTYIGTGVFEFCTNLTSITVNVDNENYSSIDGVLFDKNQTQLICCPAGKEGNYIIPSSVTSIGDSAFHSCENLTSITIPDSVIYIYDYAFDFCSGLTSVTIPYSVTYIAPGAFKDCSSLASIIVDDNNSAYCSVDGVLFDKNMETLVCHPAGKTNTSFEISKNIKRIEWYAFSDCIKLTGITIPDSVTSIGWYAFEDCTGLTSITISNSVTSIGWYTFYNCDNLTDVYYTGTESEWNEISISPENDCLTNANIHFNWINTTLKQGDIDGNNIIDAIDASYVLSEYAKKATSQASGFTESQELAADVNGDSVIDAVDASFILSYYAYTAVGGTDSFEDYMTTH